jgi:apolipoprotein N-acyltransferase
MSVLARLAVSLPAIAALALLALAVYLLVAARRSPERAQEVLMGLLSFATGFFTVFFCVASAYALIERNTAVLEVAGTFSAVAVAGWLAVRLARRRYAHAHPAWRPCSLRERLESLFAAVRRYRP